MSETSVSVVVPTYYRNDRLRAAIESALAQTHEPTEIIVVDGSGEAHAEPVVEEYDVDYVAQAEDRGAHAARSVGAERSTGAYVQFLDDDDRLRPEKFARQLPLFRDGVGVVYCGIEDAEFGVAPPDPEVRGDVLERALEMNTLPCIPSTMLVERSTLEEILPLVHRHGADDVGMKIELARRTNFDYVDEPLVERGRAENPLSRSWEHVEGRKRLLAMYDDFYDEVPDTVYREAAKQTYYREGCKHLEEAVWSPAAVASFARAARLAPEDRLEYALECLGSLFGRPGQEAVSDALG